MKRISSALLAIAVIMVLLTACASADGFPESAIGLVIPLDSGCASHRIANKLAACMADTLGVNVDLNLIPGARSAAGTMIVENGTNDGYTVLAGEMCSFVTLPVEGYTEKTYKDWTVRIVSFTPEVIAVDPWSPYGSIEELADAMAAAPEEIEVDFGSISSAGYFAAKTIEEIAGAGFAPSEGDEAAGIADVHIMSYSEAKERIGAGELKCLAVFSGEDIVCDGGTVCPSLIKIYPGLAGGFYPVGDVTAFCIPEGLEPERLEKLEEAIDYAVSLSETKEFCEENGFTLMPMTGAESRDYLDILASKACYALYDAGDGKENPALLGIYR